MTTYAIVIVILVGLLLSGYFSGSETGLYCVNKLRLHLGVQQGDPRAVRLARLIDNEHTALSVTLIGTNLMNYVTTATVTYAFAHRMGFSETQAEVYTVLALTPVVFVFGEVIPKNLFQANADKLMIATSRVLAVSTTLFRATGVVWLLTTLTRVAMRLAGGTDPSGTAFDPKRRVAALLGEALAGSAVGLDQSRLIERVIQISETPVHAVMVPRDRVLTVSAGCDRRSLLSLARKTRHARLPVYDSNRRHIIGVAKIDELLAHDDWSVVSDRLRPISVLSPHQTVAAAVNQLQDTRLPMGVVADRGGRMLGIVTLKDLLEEVVGELAEW